MDAGYVDNEVVVQESQSFLDIGHLGSNDTLQKGRRGSLKNGPIKYVRYKGLDFSVEIVDTRVEQGGGSIYPPKEAIVNGILDHVNLGVDIVGVGCRLVVHGRIDRMDDSSREVRNSDVNPCTSCGHKRP